MQTLEQMIVLEYLIDMLDNIWTLVSYMCMYYTCMFWRGWHIVIELN